MVAVIKDAKSGPAEKGYQTQRLILPRQEMQIREVDTLK